MQGQEANGNQYPDEEGGVLKIVSKSDITGLEDSFMVLLTETGRRERRSRTELKEVAPNLLAAFDKAENSRKSRSTSVSESTNTTTTNTRSTRRNSQVDDQDGEEEEIESDSNGRRRNSKRRKNAEGGSRQSYTEPNTEDEEEEEDRGESSEEESEEEDGDESGEFQVSDNEDGNEKKRKKKSRKEKQSKLLTTTQGTRHSSRDKGKKKVDYTAGGQREGSEGEEDEEMILDDREDESEEDELNINSKAEVIEIGSDAGDDVMKEEEEEGEGEGVEQVIEVNSNERPQDLHNQLCANPKCMKRPAPILLANYEAKQQTRKRTGGKRKKRSEDDFDSEEEKDMDAAKGAWIECETCVSVYHFGCLSSPLQKSLKAKLESEHSKSENKSKKRTKIELDIHKTLKIKKCTSCEKPAGTVCFGCERVGKKVTEFEKSQLEQSKEEVNKKEEEGEDVKMADEKEATSDEIVPGLMFRCQTCKRAAHYGCLKKDSPEISFADHVTSYWNFGACHDCHLYDDQWQVEVDVILGWKEVDSSKPPKGEKIKDKKTGKEFVLPSAKDPTFPAEYLIKWKGWSYRDLNWVKHSWLSARYQSRLSNFLSKGSTISFEPSKEDLGEDDELEPDAKEAQAQAQQEEDYPLGPSPDPDIERRVPQAWKTVDRVISVTFKSPLSGKSISIKDFRTKPEDDRESVKHVQTAYMKWCGLPYSQATEQPPPKEGEPGYEEFFKAYQAFLVASKREMRVPRLTPSEMAQLDAKRKGVSPVFTKQPETIKNGQLMDFQIDGLNFLLNHWWVKTGCILADEMGLGKTCQLICFLSYLNLVQKARPFLIIVPNSLVSNWLREFEKWAPELRTVAYNGDAESRRIVEQFEMFAENGDLKTHVVITTYEALKGHANVFAQCTRWDCVVIDEGQALKSGQGNKLWASIGKLKIGMKVLLTGTPLNNNLKELYNLLNFLDPIQFADVEALADPTLEMDAERVNKIRDDLRPYMLRRTKDQVLNLPPLGEFVVPVSLTLLQRQLYRGILEKNSAAILNIVNTAGKSRGKAKTTATTNTLMTLRKIVCHPYLHVPELDPGNSVPAGEAFRQLTDASAKLLLLERMLPKLREKGHKVLIFSQFKIVLNKLGPFLDGLGTKWLRLDGDTPQLERQQDVDRFNDPNSPYSVFILSTRAGGVGLTLTAADVVIIFDQDFNPFQDMQAIARAHRIGQKNPVRVFRLVVKGTCEEKILASGRKKQGLEHLIIQKIDAKNDETEDVASALQYGAQAILETDDAEAEKAAQRYTDAEIDELLSKTAEPLSEAAKESAGAFATAQVWVSEKGGLGDVSTLGEAVEEEQDLGGFWDRIVAKEAQKEQEKKEQEEFDNGGRSRRAKKAVNYSVPTALVPMTEAEKAKRRAARSGFSTDNASSGGEFRPENGHSSDDDFTPGEDLNFEARRLLDQEARPTRSNSSDPVRVQMSRKEEEEAALVRLQAKKLEKRRKAIQPLINAAKEIGDRDTLSKLQKAMNCTNAVEQKTLIVEATRVLNEKSNNLQSERKNAGKRPSAPSAQPTKPQPRPVAPASDSSTQKRKSDSPADLAQKRPKLSNEDSQPSTSTSTANSNSNAKPTSAGSKPHGASSMIRADSKGSGSEGAAKKAALSQSKLSFAPKPNSSSPAQGLSPTLHAAPSTSTSENNAAPSSKSAQAGKPVAPPISSSSKDNGKPTKKQETIVISDSEED